MSTRKERNLCSSCNNPPRAGRTLCASCASKARARTQAKRKTGLCVQDGCGNATAPGATRCNECARRHREYARVARERKKREAHIRRILERASERGTRGIPLNQ